MIDTAGAFRPAGGRATDPLGAGQAYRATRTPEQDIPKVHDKTHSPLAHHRNARAALPQETADGRR
ncbi:MAG: hypothetical protein EP318_18450 [Rhodobacteraceae bacterium]|nr:MAG: hypothetical protein EP318_18450 [Paracoccaceae bacterium]